MFDSLNHLGLPAKYAILCGMGALLGSTVYWALGYSNDPSTPAWSTVGGIIGGAMGGWIRQNRGNQN